MGEGCIPRKRPIRGLTVAVSRSSQGSRRDNPTVVTLSNRTMQSVPIRLVRTIKRQIYGGLPFQPELTLGGVPKTDAAG